MAQVLLSKRRDDLVGVIRMEVVGWGQKFLTIHAALEQSPYSTEKKTDMHNVARDGGRHRGVGVLPHHRVSRLSLGVGWLVFLLFVFAFIQLFLLAASVKQSEF